MVSRYFVILNLIGTNKKMKIASNEYIKKSKLIFFLLFLTACVSVEEQTAAVRSRASYDFSCDPNKIQVTFLQSNTFGADGCKNKQVYTTQGTLVYKEGAAPNPVYVEDPVVGGGVGFDYYRYHR